MSDTEKHPPIQWTEAHRWFAKALEDSKAAERLLTADPPLLDPAAYHCQQAAEKLLKGLLAAAGITIPKTHDLRHLAFLAAPCFPSIEIGIEQVSFLTPWGTETRYPGLDEGLNLSLSDLRSALSDIDQLYGLAMKLHKARSS